MRQTVRQFEVLTGSRKSGPIVVFAHKKNMTKDIVRRAAGNRDGPLIFHMRDGPPNVTGPPGGTGPPELTSGSGPPEKKGLSMEWLARKKMLKKSKKLNESL